MRTEEKTFRMEAHENALQYLTRNQGTKPFNCPNLLVVKKKFRHGCTEFEEGTLMCNKNFLDLCCIFNRATADEDGNIVAKCRQMVPEEMKVVFRVEDERSFPPQVEP